MTDGPDRNGVMYARAGAFPAVADGALIARTARLVGDVRVGPECVVEHGATVISGGPPVVLDRGVVVMPGAIVRSIGGRERPAFATQIGADSVIGPLAVMVGCTVGEACYIATGVMVFQGAELGAGSRLGAGSIVHVGARIPPRGRVGMRQFAIAKADGVVITGDLDHARKLLADADFFGQVFESSATDQVKLHRNAAATLRREASEWDDLLVGQFRPRASSE